MEYKIIKARQSGDLEKMVNELLKDRWRPQGGLVITQDEKSMILCQALIRTEKKTATIFNPPKLEEVKAYCKENKKNVDAEEFINFYESKGWLVGKVKMKSWQRAVDRWHKPDNKPSSHLSADEVEERNKEASKSIWEKQGFTSEEEYEQYMFEQTQKMYKGVQ